MNAYSKSPEVYIEQYESLDPGKVHAAWLQHVPTHPGVILDVGAGSGRDSAWLASMGHEVIALEPSDPMREKAQALHRHPSIQWLSDRLPSLTNIEKLSFRFDLILVSAVWMHIPATDRERAFRKLASLLRPGGKMVITLRHGDSPDDRVMHPVCSEEIRSLSRKFALEVIYEQTNQDQLKREGVHWETMVLRSPDDGTGGLPMLRHIIINDHKSSTYKLALLRVLLRIADGAQGAVLSKDRDFVTLPFGLVALYWMKIFRALILDGDFRQQGNGKESSFDKTEFRALSEISPYDLCVGAHFQEQQAENLVVSLREIRNTIKRLPAKHIKYPNSETQIFECESRLIQLKDVKKRAAITLDLDFLSEFGTFRIPRKIWDAMSSYSCWIEPAILNEWIEMMAHYDQANGNRRNYEEYQQALAWLDPVRNTQEVRNRVESLRENGKSVFCVWSGKKLTSSQFDVDHCFPFSLWGNNDLWNLLPCTTEINNKKSNKLPSAQAMDQAKERIQDWWYNAYSHSTYANRFLQEARVALPAFDTDPTNTNLPDQKTILSEKDCAKIFSALQTQRIHLKVNQQIQEWDY